VQRHWKTDDYFLLFTADWHLLRNLTSDSKIYAVKIMKLRTLKLLDLPSIYDDAALPSFMAFTIINLDSCKTLINAE
jgi:hypothetical protein